VVRTVQFDLADAQRREGIEMPRRSSPRKEYTMSHTPSASAHPHSSPDATPDREQVEARAYFRYVERGRTDGQALDDWLVAETEVRQKAGRDGDG
jgi:hypothetical protein